MGSFVSVSALLLVSGGCIMYTLGAELGGFCMICTLGSWAGEGGR